MPLWITVVLVGAGIGLGVIVGAIAGIYYVAKGMFDRF